MDEDKNDKPDEEAKADEKDEEEDDGMPEEEKRKLDGAEEPPAFGVEGDGGDSSVLDVAKEEVNFLILVLYTSYCSCLCCYFGLFCFTRLITTIRHWICLLAWS